MKRRSNLPVVALRAFEVAARHGTLTAAAEELCVSHGAVSRHVSNLEDFIGAALFDGPRNRPRLTAQGQAFGFALTAAFDQIEDAVRFVSRRESNVLDIGCLGTFAMRWLIPRLTDFAGKHPSYNVRILTDQRPERLHCDVHIDVVPPHSQLGDDKTVLFEEQLSLVIPEGTADSTLMSLARLETKTRPRVWGEWLELSAIHKQPTSQTVRMFDHYHLTIEGVLNGLGAAVVPLHLVTGEIKSGRLIASFGFAKSGYRYVASVSRPASRKTRIFVNWLQSVAAESVLPGLPSV